MSAVSNVHLLTRPAAGFAIALVVAVGLLTACGVGDRQEGAARVEGDNDGYHGTVVDPPLEVAPITLRDTTGNPVALERLPAGKATAIFFGFTNCDDVCPTTMADLAVARRTLPAELANQVRLVFITVDPKRDTPPVLRTWLYQFDPDIVGLRGPLPAVHRAERSLFASESAKAVIDPAPSAAANHEDHREGRKDPATPGRHEAGYEVDHTSVVYLFGPQRESLLYTGGATPTDYAEDFTRLLSAN